MQITIRKNGLLYRIAFFGWEKGYDGDHLDFFSLVMYIIFGILRQLIITPLEFLFLGYVPDWQQSKSVPIAWRFWPRIFGRPIGLFWIIACAIFTVGVISPLTFRHAWHLLPANVKFPLFLVTAFLIVGTFLWLVYFLIIAGACTAKRWAEKYLCPAVKIK